MDDLKSINALDRIHTRFRAHGFLQATDDIESVDFLVSIDALEWLGAPESMDALEWIGVLECEEF